MPVSQIAISQGRTAEQESKKELLKVLTRRMGRIINAREDIIRILVYEVLKENF